MPLSARTLGSSFKPANSQRSASAALSASSQQLRRNSSNRHFFGYEPVAQAREVTRRRDETRRGNKRCHGSILLFLFGFSRLMSIADEDQSAINNRSLCPRVFVFPTSQPRQRKKGVCAILLAPHATDGKKDIIVHWLSPRCSALLATLSSLSSPKKKAL